MQTRGLRVIINIPPDTRAHSESARTLSASTGSERDNERRPAGAAEGRQPRGDVSVH